MQKTVTYSYNFLQFLVDIYKKYVILYLYKYI